VKLGFLLWKCVDNEQAIWQDNNSVKQLFHLAKRELFLKKYAILVTVFWIFFAVSLFSGAAEIGTTSNNYLKILPPAKPASMGEAYVATGDDVASIFYNPAGLAKSLLDEISFTHIEWFQAFRYESLSLLLPFEFGNLALSLNYMSVPSMDKTAIDATSPTGYTVLGSITPYAFSGIASYSAEFTENFYLGANLKILNYAIDPLAAAGGSATSFMVDLGLIYDMSFLQGLSAGLVLKNVGFETKFITQGFMQPITARLGLGYANSFLNFETDAEYVSDNDINYAFGGGFTLFDVLSLRAGWKGGTINQFTAGAGFNFKGVSIDYAYVPYATEDLGLTHRVTLSYKFGSPEVKIRMSPNVFSPNNDRYLDFTFCIAKLMAKGKIKRAHLTIYNSDNIPVKSNLAVTTWSRIYWNGYNDFRKVCPDGIYRAVLTVDYGGGLISDSNSAIVALDNTPPVVDGDANPKEVTPGSMTTLLVPVTFSESARDLHGIGAWRIVIGTLDGKVFKTFSGQGEPNQVTWDGSDDTGLNFVNTSTIYNYTFFAMDRVGNWGRSQTKQVKVLPREIVINLASDTLFDLGKADVKISVYKDLQAIADQIKGMGKTTVIVEGHTDNATLTGKGKYVDNMVLSQARADAVAKFFAELFNMDPKIFTAIGKGDTQPIATNDTPEGRKKNRRVTMRITAVRYE